MRTRVRRRFFDTSRSILSAGVPKTPRLSAGAPRGSISNKYNIVHYIYFVSSKSNRN